MPITTIDSTAALMIVDLQAGFIGTPSIEPVTDVATRVGQLADAFRANNLPVVLVTVEGGAPGRTDSGVASDRIYPAGFADPLPELGQHEGDHVVSKSRWSALQGTGVFEYLQEHSVTHVVITGVATSIGVESTARAAYDHGLHVTVAVDGVTDFDPAAHEHSITRVFPRLAETGTVSEIEALLAARR
jgi:nicotinamidase-related amidase